MFILSYVYTTIIMLTDFVMLTFGMTTMVSMFVWSIILGIIFALLYANLIILCKYSVIFVEKNIKKEKLSEMDIYYLVTSTVIFVTVGVVLTPMYDINEVANVWSSYNFSISKFFIEPIFFVLIYIAMLIFPLYFIAEAFLQHDIGVFFEFIGMFLFMWANFIILCKYLYRFVCKTIKQEPLSQKDSIFLITSLLVFVTIGVIFAVGGESV